MLQLEINRLVCGLILLLETTFSQKLHKSNLLIFCHIYKPPDIAAKMLCGYNFQYKNITLCSNPKKLIIVTDTQKKSSVVKSAP